MNGRELGEQITELSMIKEMELDILQHVAEFCEKNGLQYILGYGTLLGAVRHKGFIPWDDDIDIMMPRRDYDRLVELWQDDDRYQMLECKKNRDYPYAFAKACRADTYMKEKGAACTYDLGLYVDIFPYDPVPENPRKAAAIARQMKLLEKMRMYAMFPEEKLLRTGSRWNADRKLLYRVLRGITPQRLARLQDRRARRCPAPAGGYGGFLSTRYAVREIQPLENFQNTIMMEFEGKHFRVPAAYDSVLRLLYGDYMKLPPAEERVLKHGFALWQCR